MIQAAILAPIFASGAPWGSDQSLHYAEALALAESLRAGDLHWWNDSANLGFASGYYYQVLPQLLAAVAHTLCFDAISFTTIFKLSIIAPMVLLPATTYRALRVAGMDRGAALGAALAAGMVTSTMTWGHGPDGVLTRGIYTQAWALLFYPLALAHGARFLATGAGLFPALVYALLTGACHPFIAVCLAPALLVTPWWRAGLRKALVRSLVLAGTCLCLSAFMWLPVLVHYDSFGGFPNRGAGETGIAADELAKLLAGDLLDANRWPVLTVLSAIALVVALRRAHRLLLVLVGQALLFGLFVGIGPIVGALPDDLLPAVRFVAPLQLTLAVVAGVTAALAVRALRPRFAYVAAGLVTTFLGVTTATQVYTRYALFFDHRTSIGDEVQQMSAQLAALPDGRLAAAETYGVPHGNHWWYYLPAVDGGKPVLRGYGGGSLQSSGSYRYLYNHADFDPRRHAKLYNVRWLLARKGFEPKGLDAPKRAETRDHVVLELDGGGYFQPIQLVGRTPQARDRRERAIRRWLSAASPRNGRHLLVSGPADLYEPITGTVLEEHAGPSRYEASVSVDGTTVATFLLKVTYHPGWRVRVDGRDAEVLRVSPDMMAVQVPPGRHDIAFEFRRPWWVFALMLASIAGLVWLARRERETVALRVQSDFA